MTYNFLGGGGGGDLISLFHLLFYWYIKWFIVTSTFFRIFKSLIYSKHIPTGIQGALKHDVIMDPSKHDYMIVETEAVKALKRSRSQCLGPMTGVPNWTGQHGSMAKR